MIKERKGIKMAYLSKALYLKKIAIYFIISGLFIACRSEKPALEINDLRLEYLSNPVGIDNPVPRMSWKIVSSENDVYQSALQVLVASSAELLSDEKADIWNSGKVSSPRKPWVRYGGKPLKHTTSYYWKVRAWDEANQSSFWSEPAKFTTGYFNNTQWQNQWIAHQPDSSYQARKYMPPIKFDLKNNPEAVVPNKKDAPAIYMRKNQELDQKPVSALVLISALGYYELYVNGKKIGNQVLDPAFSDYGRRIYYNAFELNDHFHEGVNTLGIILGNGFYNIPTRDLFQVNRAYWKGHPKVILDIVLTYADGSREVITTGSGWKWNTGEITFNCIRGGETIDLRKSLGEWLKPDYKDTSWKEVALTQPPVNKMSFQVFAPMRYNDTIEARDIWEPKKDTYVVDFGRNITGTVMMEVHGNTGDSIVFDFNEALLEDSTLNLWYSAGHTFGRFQKGILVLGDKGFGVGFKRYHLSIKNSTSPVKCTLYSTGLV